MASPQSKPAPLGVSIVVPAFNASATIAATLDSLVAQTHRSWDAIVVDDGSTDDTAEIVTEYAARDGRITLVRQGNAGESAARNTGIAQAIHAWMLFLDADDWLAPTHLQKMIAAVAADPTLDAVHCRYARVAADGTQIVEQYSPPTGDLFHVLARRAAFPVHACLVRTSVVRDVGLFDVTLKTSPDWDLWQRIARTGARFGAVQEVLAYYRMSPSSASLDARQLFLDGVRIIRQGLTRDPRVKCPHPDHADGAPVGSVESQEFYLLCWCAGLMIGSNTDARPLLDLVGNDRFPELWAPAVAQCLFESIPLPACSGPSLWQHVWPTVHRHISDFLVALERQTAAPDLARMAQGHLSRMVVDSSPALSLLNDELRSLSGALRDEVAQVRASASAAERAAADWQLRAREREAALGEQQQAFIQARDTLTTLVTHLQEHQALLTEARGQWQALAEERQQMIAACSVSLAEMERELAARTSELGAAQEQAARLAQQLQDERAGRVLVEQQLQRRDREINALDETLRERDEALREKLGMIAALTAEGEQRALREQELESALRREGRSLQRAARVRQHLEETLDWLKKEADRARAEAQEAHEQLRLHAASAQQNQRELEARARDREQQHAQALADLRGSAEWRIGDLLWNRAGLSALGRPAARLVRRAHDRRTRAVLVKAAETPTPPATGSRPSAARRAVAAACWNFPVPSQTFVYQEVQGLEWAGFDYRFFCCESGPKEALPSAFQAVWDRHVVLKTDWEINRADYEHFLASRRDRVESLLDRLGAATGLSGDDLLAQPIVMTGFTFARHVELYGASYLHTYFFYDQSFMGLMAGWLLGIPRGITAYADHMLDDYQFKLVPLQIELADIVVATSTRIKQELSGLTGGRYDTKIIVKPNGVNTERFPYVPASKRLAEHGERELISVSRIEPKKGLIHLVDAVGILASRGVRVRVNIVGGVDQHTPTSAECHRELVARIDELGLGDLVVLHGPKQQSEFIPIMARSHAFVAPYVEVSSGDKDGIPTAVLEAMSCGLPIVATDAGSITEAVTHDVEALVVPQRDAERLADAIESLFTDSSRYVRMSDAARARALREFDARVTERRLHDRIASVLAANVA